MFSSTKISGLLLVFCVVFCSVLSDPIRVKKYRGSVESFYNDKYDEIHREVIYANYSSDGTLLVKVEKVYLPSIPEDYFYEDEAGEKEKKKEIQQVRKTDVTEVKKNNSSHRSPSFILFIFLPTLWCFYDLSMSTS